MAMGGTPSTARHNVVVIRSESPRLDAETSMRLFPNKFMLETSRKTSSMVLVEKVEPSTPGGTTLILVPNDSSSENPAVPESGRALEATLVLRTEEIRSAVARSRTCDATVAFTKSLSVSSETFVCAMISLPGGGRILLVTPELVESTEGRLLLAQMVALPEKIQETANGDTGNNIAETFADIDLSDAADIEIETENGRSIMREELEAPLPKFPSLAVSVMQQNGRMEPNFPINSRVGVPVETDLFVGKLLLVLRPSNPLDDPYYNEKIFSKKKRRFICQLQGKFKYVPKGTVYAGGEVSEQMKLGLVGKGLCSIILNLLRSFFSEMHFSFGDSKNVETPHIVFPALKFFDNIVVTKPGDVPPPISEPFVEAKASREARNSSRGVGFWNTDNTYSMSFYSMYLDLVNWHVVQLPVTKDLDLRTFWGNSLLSVVLYEKGEAREERHIKEYNKYIFKMQMKFLGHHAVSDQEEASSEDEDILPWDKARPLAIPNTPSRPRYERQASGAYLGVGSDSEDTRFFDAEEAEVGLNVEDDGWFYFDSVQPPVPKSNTEMSSMVDILCPAWIEICSAKGKYTTLYAFNLKNGTETLFRTTSQFSECFDTEQAKRTVGLVCSPRMSSSERARRLMGQTFAQALKSKDASTAGKSHQFKMLKTEFDSAFLKKPISTVSIGKTSRPVLKCGYVARALSERQWIEEWATVTDRYISFHHPAKQKINFRISLTNIVNVRELSKNESPGFPLHSFMAIETLGRTVYLMLAGEAERNHWVVKLRDMKAYAASKSQDMSSKVPSSKGSEGKRSIGSDILLAVDDPTEEFLHKSSLWSCKQRKILNCRKFAFTGVHKNLNAAEAVEDALKKSLDPVGDSEEGNLRAFLDSCSVLKEVDVNDLDEKAKLAFFLNLYHVMIMHAFLVLGTPDSAFKWMSYFNMIAYQCSDDIFSLTELEHNIIRASMNYPSQFISKFVLPKSQFRFALTLADYRINFALNCGSRSNPGFIPIYKAECLDQQLDKAAAAYLRVVQVTPKGNGSVVVTLPRICQWFAEDFGRGSNADVIRLIARYLKEKDRKLLMKPLSEEHHRFGFGDLSVKYLSYSFECRNLRLEDSVGGGT